MKRHATVDEFIKHAEQFRPELIKLRKVLLGTELDETVKWGAPCYTIDGKNVVGIGSFKSYCGLWFFNGAQMDDPRGVLINAQEGKTKAMRQWRFSSAAEIKVRDVKAYVSNAIEVQRTGKVLKPARGAPVTVPEELQRALDKNKRTTAAFASLTPGRQREYAEYIAEAKRDETKARRLEKILPMIRSGIGLHEKYRNC